MELSGGSSLLQSLSNGSGVPLDQLNFMACEVAALLLAFAYRHYLHPKLVSPHVRHVVAGSLGLFIGFFCFGRQVIHMVAQASVCYGVMRFWPSKNQHIVAFAFAILYLSVMHLWRMFYDYGGYKLDITGPLMISTQKVTSLAFSVHDGLYKDKKDLNPDQSKYAVRKLPNPLVYFSYIFYFQGILVGPLCFYADYINFIDGPKGLKTETLTSSSEADGVKLNSDDSNADGKTSDSEELNVYPSPYTEVAKKMGITLACAGVAFLVAPSFGMEKNTDLDYIYNYNFFYRVMFLIFTCTVARAKYYFAFKFGEAVNNASGLGFNGYTEDKEPQWDLLTNVNIRKLETGTSLKVIIDNWNVQTSIWLRRICYDRMHSQKMAWTFVLSALWHGFYPGYYFTFLGSTFFIAASRKVRRTIRPYFLTAWWKKTLYDVTTWFFGQLSLAYLILPFSCLEFWPVFNFYHKSMHWFLHLGVIAVIMVLPSKVKEVTSQ